MITFKCVKCGCECQADDCFAGNTAECQSCENVNVVPKPDTQPESKPQVADTQPGTPSQPTSEKIKQAAVSMCEDEKTWAIFCNLGPFAYFIPFGNILLPLIIWLIKKDSSPLVDATGKAALNFQISMVLYFAVGVVACFIIVGAFIIPAVIVFNLICSIIAAVKASDGEVFDYPLSIKFIH